MYIYHFKSRVFPILTAGQVAMVEQKLKKARFPYVFLLISLLLMVGVYVLLTKTMEQSLYTAVIKATQAGNKTITQVFINEVYPQLRQDLALTDYEPQAKQALTEAELERVDKRVRQFMFGTDVLKAKIYNIAGITLYSSDLSQVGESKRDNQGFSSAVRGIPASQVTHRGQFSALDGEVFDRDLVASYIPIRDKQGDIIGVAELYTDRSFEMKETESLIVELKSQLLPSLMIILLLVAIIIWRFTSYITRLRLEMIERE